MEDNAGSSHSNENQPVRHSGSANESNMPPEQGASSSEFVNHAAIAWHESRRKWIGDQSQQLERTKKEQVISWSTTYEELLSTNRPFAEPIPLPEMVDFLVDIWQNEGLYD